MNAKFLSDAVESAFAGLIAKYGFVVRDSDDTTVVLDSSSVRIDITYDWRNSFEVDVGISELRNGVPSPSIPFNLGEVFRELQVPNADRVGFLQSSKEADVVTFLNKTAERLATYCDSCIVGDAKQFEAIARRRSHEAMEYTRKVQLASVRERADQAWRNKRYREFVVLMEGFASWLSDADKKKLEYAIKQCSHA